MSVSQGKEAAAVTFMLEELVIQRFRYESSIFQHIFFLRGNEQSILMQMQLCRRGGRAEDEFFDAVAQKILSWHPVPS
jgi:hypothetical protein